MKRRAWLTHSLALASAGQWLAPAHAQSDPHPGLPDPRPLQLGQAGGSGRDHGSHPEWNTEWWYITGWANPGPLDAQATPAYGFQITFFRSRVNSTHALQAPLAAVNLISVHLAITDVQSGRLRHEERVGRAARNPALSLGDARTDDLHVRLGNWQLTREGPALHARLPGRELALDLDLQLTQAPLLQGQGGLSRKGPDAQQISYYYSLPQLQTTGSLRLGNARHAVRGRAWLDHEWSTALMHPDAVGWDWIGMNLDDGSALTAFRLRTAQGQTLWTGGSWRGAGQQREAQIFGGRDVVFTPLAFWESPDSQARYPIRWRVQTPAGVFEVHALTPRQELDARASTGAIYWEGLCALLSAQGQRVGWGYLEMTGYAHRLRL